jgi:hypothetical protein
MRNDKFQKVASTCLLGTFVTVLLVLSTPSYAQISGAVKGQPVIATSATTATSDVSYVDAFVNSTSGDMCARILAAWSALTNSGTIDARGFTGAQSCAASPFAPRTSPKFGKLLLGNVIITTSVSWVIPTRVQVEGLGTATTSLGIPATTANTIIRAGSAVSGNPLIQMGDGDPTSMASFGVGLKGLTVDCFGVSCTTGILNDSAEEGSFIQDVNVFNAPAIGIRVTTNNGIANGAANSGPYRNINIQYNSHCTTCGLATVGLQVDGSNTGHVIRGFDNLTVSSSGISTAAQGILIYGLSTQVTNSHVEFFPTGIQIGLSGSTNNVQVENVSVTGVSSGPDVLIDSGTGDVLLSGITDTNASGAIDILQDKVTGNTLTTSADKFLGWYFLGQGTSPAVFTSSSSVGWQAPENLNVSNSLSSTTLNVTGSKHFKIDDPLDPAHKYLYHSVIESPDMMNVYNGSVTTDKRGTAVVTLPEYFEALNKDFRYQLTAIGTFAQATVAKEIENNRFTIRTSKPGVKVSWQVTGIRHDAYADAHRITAEQEKPPRERGHYLHPELFENSGKGTIAKRDDSK